MLSILLPEIFFIQLNLSMYILSVTRWKISFETAIYVIRTFLLIESQILQSM